MPKIKTITAREILDSRGNPTVEAKIGLDNGIIAKASVPSGASGAEESCDLRDGDKKRYAGMGVLKAVKNVEEKIAPALIGTEITEQEKIDRLMIELDGTKNKNKLGANGMLAVSLACARAGALSENSELFSYLGKIFNLGKPGLPVPCFNLFNGGVHADTNLDFEEFVIIPQGKIKEKGMAEMVRMGAEIFHELGRVLKEARYDTDVGLEGGYAPDIHSSIQAIELIIASGIRSGFKPGADFGIGIDVGSGKLYNRENGKYVFKLDNASFTSMTLAGLYYEWFRKYPLIYLEDGLAEDDLAGWKDLNKLLGGEIMLVGDDLFKTDTRRLREGLAEKAANALTIKPSQAGTLTEAVECAKLAKKHNLKTVVSHRSGETNDDFIADLAYALGVDYIKAGSLSRGERVAKYNRLMEIEILVS